MSTPPPDDSDLSDDQQPARRTLRLAGFGARLAGGLLDIVLYGLVWAVFAVPGVLVRRQGYDECVWYRGERFCPDGWPKPWLVAAGIALILIGGVVALTLYSRALGRTGRTWGRTIVGIEVVSRHDGLPLGVATALGRTLFAIVSAAACALGYLWMLWDKDRQTWHDKVAYSIVVRA